jgi:hypothetical protein
LVAKEVKEEKGLRNIRTLNVEFDSGSKIRETDEAVIVSAVLARECVSNYCNGRGYKPGSELKAAAFTLDGAWVVVYGHIPTVHVQNREVIRGRVRDVAFNEEINGVVGDLCFLKACCDQALLDKVRKGELAKDVSAAYFADEVSEPGEFGDDVYDFVQRNIMFGHVAVGLPEGRCPSPFCGLQMDSFDGFLRVNVRDPGLFACRLSTLAVNAQEGIYALVGKLKQNLQPSGYAEGDAVVRDFLFEVSKGWTPETANAYVKEHSDSANEPTGTSEGLGACVKLDPNEVLAQSRRLLSNMPSIGGRQNVMTSAGWGARHHDGAL